MDVNASALWDGDFSVNSSFGLAEGKGPRFKSTPFQVSLPDGTILDGSWDWEGMVRLNE